MKILVFGDSEGCHERTLEKAAKLAAKQSFDYLLCLGTFFHHAADTVEHEPAIKTYYQHAQFDPEVAESWPTKLFKLTDGVIDLTDKLTLASYTIHDGDEFEEEVDILLTSRSPRLESEDGDVAEWVQGQAAAHLPRYHFYASMKFEERKPYKTEINGKTRITREIGLAPVANEAKEKWFYAFNLTTGSNDGPTDTIPNPYKSKSSADTKASTPPQAIKAHDEKRPPHGYICKICSIADDHYFKDCPQKGTNKRKRGHQKPERRMQKKVDPASCFFCLSNPNLARHLIVSIGEYSYLALPKGGMTENHILIIPIDHKATLSNMGEARSFVEAEMTRYIDALQNYYQSLNTTAILFEISRSNGVHLHYQIMPVPESKTSELAEAFYAFAEIENITLEDRGPKPDESEFFRVLFPASKKSLTGVLDPSKRFDLQFGRRVIADIMGVPERAHWKDCLRTNDQESTDSEKFKIGFKKFDFTI